jgi:hypothetical protein
LDLCSASFLLLDQAQATTWVRLVAWVTGTIYWKKIYMTQVLYNTV